MTGVRRKWSRGRRLAWLVVVLSAAACGSPAREGDGAVAWERAALEFAGGKSCAECHAREHELWRGSHHDLAMQEATAATVVGDFENAEFTYAGTVSRFFRRDDAFFVSTDGPTGELEEFRIAYTFGVEPLQQYLVEFPDGRIQALPICWDTRPAEAGGQRWFHLYPDERITHDDPLHWTGLQQNWNFMCAECHSTGLDKGYDEQADRYATTWTEIDVSCEACHGPGARHVAWAEARERGESVDEAGDLGLAVILKDRDGAAWVIDPESGIAARTAPRTSRAQLETCARCHSRRSVIAPDYVHGRPLADSHRPALLEQGLYHADGQILDEVYVYGSFLQSKMHAAGVTCSDCHDPHSAKLERGEADASCSRCHLSERFEAREHHFHEPGTRGASCVECHMPSRDYMVVDPRRDHSFRVPRPELSVDLGTPNACNGCHRDRSSEWARAAVEEWYGAERLATPRYPRALHAARNGTAEAEALLIATVTDPAEPGIARATATAALGGYLGPGSLPALRHTLDDADPLVRAAAVALLEALPPDLRIELGAPALGDPIRLVRTQAARSLVSTPPGAMGSLERDALTAALEEYREEQRANADRAEANVNLGILETILGNAAAAERALRRALALDSTYVPAYMNLADLYNVEGRDGDGERLLREAIGVAPREAILHHALGLLLVRRQRLTEALEELELAATQAPDEARFAFVYGVALNSAGEPRRAIEVLAAAHRRAPRDPELLHALATISRDAGAHEEALAYAHALRLLAPDDDGVRQLVAQLERLR